MRKSITGKDSTDTPKATIEVNKAHTGMIDSTLDERYKILSLIGEGTMSLVFKANHLLMNRLVAIKVLKQSSTESTPSLDRFRREALAIGRLSHPKHRLDLRLRCEQRGISLPGNGLY